MCDFPNLAKLGLLIAQSTSFRANNVFPYMYVYKYQWRCQSLFSMIRLTFKCNENVNVNKLIINFPGNKHKIFISEQMYSSKGNTNGRDT